MLAVEVLAELYRIAVIVREGRAQRKLRIEMLLDRGALKNLRQLIADVRTFCLIAVARNLANRTDRQRQTQRQGGAASCSGQLGGCGLCAVRSNGPRLNSIRGALRRG